jgi:hypothetical protein
LLKRARAANDRTKSHYYCEFVNLAECAEEIGEKQQAESLYNSAMEYEIKRGNYFHKTLNLYSESPFRNAIKYAKKIGKEKIADEIFLKVINFGCAVALNLEKREYTHEAAKRMVSAANFADLQENSKISNQLYNKSLELWIKIAIDNEKRHLLFQHSLILTQRLLVGTTMKKLRRKLILKRPRKP